MYIMSSYEVTETRKCKGGKYYRVSHDSTSTKTKMIFSVFLPDNKPAEEMPVLYYLSGLTCTDQNFITKASAAAFPEAVKHGIALVVPDTSPRDASVEGEDDVYWFGTGASWYVDATKEPYSKNYNMYTYLVKELPLLLKSKFNLIVEESAGITGHSMGGHGALTIGLKNPTLFRSCSAFAPVVSPSEWTEYAYNKYFENYEVESDIYYSTSLVKKAGAVFEDILIDQGDSDEFYTDGNTLQPELFVDACKDVNQKVTLRIQSGYDHSYYFVSSFIADHIRWHAFKLNKIKQDALAEKAIEAATLLIQNNKTFGKTIICQAMVAFEPKKPLTLCEIEVAPPKAGEVRLKVVANALCHTDCYTLNGEDPEGLFPSILGHEAGCIVESVGEGVTSVQVGDHVIPAYTPQCCLPQCIFCMSPKTNLCPAIRGTQGKGVMPDGTSRFKLKSNGQTIYHFMGTSTFAEYTVVSEWSCAKINMAASLKDVCLLGCGIATGLGAVWNNCKVEAGSTVAVFGLGAVGLSVINACQMAGCKQIVGIDVNPNKFQFAMKHGATMCVNPTDDHVKAKGTIQSYLVSISKTGFGFDYTFDATGNVNVMRSAIECAHRGWGMSCIIGVAAAGKEISTRPFQLVTGRRWIGTAFGGWKSRSDIPTLVNRVLDGNLDIKSYITHRLKGVEQTNAAIDILKEGNCLRCVIEY